MAHNLILVNGEELWEAYFPEQTVYRVRLQTSKWLLQHGTLWVFDEGQRIRVDSLLWRIGATRPQPYYRDVLELVRYANVPCVNAPHVLLHDLHRLTMLNDLRQCDLPVIPFAGIVGDVLMGQIPPQLPAVIKIGSHHAGYGKMRLTSLEQWQDMMDVVVASNTYFTIEPYIDYVQDIRMMAVGERIWAMARKGSRWKANAGQVDTQLIAAPASLYDYTQRIMQHLNADVLALDILETSTGDYYVLESNAVPGLDGFPEAVSEAIAERLKSKINGTAP
jgi:ribosomal protein S6--L-glutamate ligase